MLSILSSVCWPSVCLWRDVCLGLLLIFSLGWLVHCLFYWAAWVVCIFWRLIPCSLPHLQIFSLILGIVFLFITSFAVQKLLSLIRSHLFIFVFIFITLGDGWKKPCCDLCQRVFYLCFPLEFHSVQLYIRSLIHFEFIFVCGNT